MERSRTTIQVDGRGRILLPKPLRERLGIRPKAMIDVEMGEDGSLVLRDVRDQRRRELLAAQGSMAGRGGSVDDLIAQRRDAAACESGGK